MSVGRLLFLALFLATLSSCKLFYPNYMFRDNKSIVYYEFADSMMNTAQTIMPGDIITFNLATRDGYELVDVVSNTNGANNRIINTGSVQYVVRTDGVVEFPLVGEINVEGMTRLDLENLLEEKYASVYNDPFILLNVTNRRAWVFMGLGGAKVVSLPNENTTLIQVIALSGGIPAGAKSHRIRVIRGDLDAPSIKKVDLSTIAGLKDADMIIQPNDLIVVEPRTPVAPAILKELTPIISLIASITTLYVLVRRF